MRSRGLFPAALFSCLALLLLSPLLQTANAAEDKFYSDNDDTISNKGTKPKLKLE